MSFLPVATKNTKKFQIDLKVCRESKTFKFKIACAVVSVLIMSLFQNVSLFLHSY